MSGATEKAQGKILVIRGGAIGDFVLTLPVLAALREQFPRAHLEVLGYPHIAQLAKAGGLVDRVQSIEARALAGFFAEFGSLDLRLAEYFAGFSLVLSYLFDPDGVFQRNVARCSKAQFLAASHRPNESENTHATEVFLKPLEQLAMFHCDAVPRLNLSSRNERLPRAAEVQVGSDGAVPIAGSSESARPVWLAMHPGSGSERKNWPEARWSELLRHLVEATAWNLVLIGGEAEGERLARLAPLIPVGRRELAQNLPLTELAARLEHCSAYLGHDSGISHLAAAVGLPGVILWGETNPSIWRPRSDRMRILTGTGPLTEMPVVGVLGALRALPI